MNLAVDPYDEAQIKAVDAIIRRISLKDHVVWDENRQRHRIASNAYRKSSGPKGGMSVDIEALITATGQDPRVYVTTPVFIGSVVFSATDVRSLGLWIGYEPIPDNPHHGEVWATTDKKHFSDAQKTGLAKAARWYVELPDVDIR